MAGPAIRAFEMARVLSEHCEVRLVSTSYSSLPHQRRFEVYDLSGPGFERFADWAEVIVLQGHVLKTHPWVLDKPARVVADLYDPMHLEILEQDRDLDPAVRHHRLVDTVEVLNQQVETADFLICASEKQRDFWLGALAALGRVNPVTYDEDGSLRSLLDVVPFGLDDTPPVQRRHAIKGRVQGIASNDRVIIWGGGVYNWFDPLTLVRAVADLAVTYDDVRLFFLGGQHPNPDVPAMRMLTETRALADALGLTGRVVFFNEDWVPYEERADYLLDADLGVSTHVDHLETAYSFRTRMLDYLWASLPMVSTDGDGFAALIRENGLGAVVPPNDASALRNALERLLYDDAARAAARVQVGRVAERFRWRTVLTPLVEYCIRATEAPDLQSGVRLPLQIRLDVLERRIEGMEKSTSWRVTAPMRRVMAFARRVTGREDRDALAVQKTEHALRRAAESRR